MTAVAPPSGAATAVLRDVFGLAGFRPGQAEIVAAAEAGRDLLLVAPTGSGKSIGYWVPDDPEKSKTTLTYIISHASREQATKNWQDFRNDPEWKKVSADSEANGKIVQKVDSVYLNPTDFSKLK